MKTHIYLLLALVSLSALTSCRDCGRGSRSIESKTFNESGFSTVEAGGSFNVSIKYGDSYSIKVTTQERILDNVQADKTGSRLELKLDKRHCNCDVPIEVEITMPELNGVNATGGSTFNLENFSGSSINFEISGGANVEAEDLSISSINIEASGGSEIVLNGSAEDIDIEMSGGSQVYLYNISSETVDVNGSGGSKAEIRANQRISANLSGGTKVEYKGNATISSVSTSGGSSLVNRN
jgi:hypothetical protein